jgi:hypothetical protein
MTDQPTTDVAQYRIVLVVGTILEALEKSPHQPFSGYFSASRSMSSQIQEQTVFRLRFQPSG